MKNKIYQEERNALIPEAVKYADAQAGPTKYDKNLDERHRWSFVWNKAFHNKMNELAKEKGLT